MAYSDFKTLEQVHEELGLVIQGDNNCYRYIKSVRLTGWFVKTMDLAYTKAIRINTESAWQALIVDNVLIELEQHVAASFFLESTFNVDSEKGLIGNPDGIISKSTNQLYITSPAVVLVEAKKSDLGNALPQCLSEMEAARIFNERHENPVFPIYGVVTDGVLWQFVSLENNIATIDSTLYTFEGGGMIVGILKFCVENSR